MSNEFSGVSIDTIMSSGYDNPLKGKTLILKPGVPVTIRILGFESQSVQEIPSFRSHYIYDPTLPESYKSKKKYVPCLGENCPMCKAGHQASDRYVFMVDHLDNYEMAQNGSAVRHPCRKILIAGTTLTKLLASKQLNVRPLSSSNIQIVSIASGSKTTTYSIDFVEGPYNPNEIDPNGVSYSLLKPTSHDIADASRLAASFLAYQNQSQPQQSFGYNQGMQMPYKQQTPANQYYQQAPANQYYQQSQATPQFQNPPQDQFSNQGYQTDGYNSFQSNMSTPGAGQSVSIPTKAGNTFISEGMLPDGVPF